MTQLGNSVGGDQAGRDVNKYYQGAAGPRTFMTRVNEEIRLRCEASEETRQAIDRLRHYKEHASGEPVLGLEKKLDRAGRKHWVASKSRAKERFAMRLAGADFSPTSQLVLLWVLTEALTRVENFVAPLVKSGATEEDILEAVQRKVVGELMAQLEENPLALMSDEVEGAVWYLTGNCFVDWRQDA